MNGHAIRELAQAWATVVHDGQSRKGAGEPYIEHPRRIAAAVWGWRRKSLAWLHDVIEDAPDPVLMEAALRVVFPEDLVDDLVRLSRLPDPTTNTKPIYMDWIREIRLSGRPDAVAVKLADVEDNLRDIEDVPGARGMVQRYLRAKAELLDAAV